MCTALTWYVDEFHAQAERVRKRNAVGGYGRVMDDDEEAQHVVECLDESARYHGIDVKRLGRACFGPDAA